MTLQNHLNYKFIQQFEYLTEIAVDDFSKNQIKCALLQHSNDWHKFIQTENGTVTVLDFLITRFKNNGWIK